MRRIPSRRFGLPVLVLWGAGEQRCSHVPLAIGASSASQQVVDDRPFLFEDTFSVMSSASVIYVLNESSTSQVVASGCAHNRLFAPAIADRCRRSRYCDDCRDKLHEPTPSAHSPPPGPIDSEEVRLGQARSLGYLSPTGWLGARAATRFLPVVAISSGPGEPRYENGCPVTATEKPQRSEGRKSDESDRSNRSKNRAHCSQTRRFLPPCPRAWRLAFESHHRETTQGKRRRAIA